MVRNIVGALALVGREKKTPEWVREVLACRDRRRAAATAPAQGLFLLRVDYEEAVSPTSTTSQAGQGGVIQGDGEGATA